jgi:hypothetical protein
MKIRVLIVPLFLGLLSVNTSASLIGFTTFDKPGSGSGVTDNFADVNTTDNSVHGSSYSKSASAGSYTNSWLTANIGYWSSGTGNKAGGNPSDSVLNDDSFGDPSKAPISNYTSSYNSSGSKQIKFYNGKLKVDFAVNNHSDYVFRVEKLHYDVHVGNANSANDLQVVYLSAGPRSGQDFNLTGGEWINKSLGTEFVNLKLVRQETDLPIGELDRTVCLSCQDGAVGSSGGIQIGGVNTKSYIPSGEGAAFRFILSKDDGTVSGPTYIDNLAFEGSFWTDETFSEQVFPNVAPIPLPSALLLFLSGISGLIVRKKLL